MSLFQALLHSQVNKLLSPDKILFVAPFSLIFYVTGDGISWHSAAADSNTCTVRTMCSNILHLPRCVPEFI